MFAVTLERILQGVAVHIPTVIVARDYQNACGAIGKKKFF